MRLTSIGSAAALAAMLIAPASAGIIPYASRTAFDAQGTVTSIDWSVFGPFGTTISTPDFRTVGSVTVGVASSQGELSRHDEGTDFSGDFAPGDHLLTDAGSESDSFIISFGAPVRGFGAQVEPDYLTGDWSGTVTLYDASSTVIGTFAILGTRGTAEDNSAPFFGFISSVADISFATFVVDQSAISLPPAGAVAVNTMDVLGVVPESSSLSMAAAGLLGLAGMFLLRRRAITS